MRSTALPAKLDEMHHTGFYSVDGIADIWESFEETDGSKTLAIPLISKQCVGWIGQLLSSTHAWALHGDGKHKLHIGRWILMTFGTHCLNWDREAKSYRHSFRPLVYLFSKNHESVSAGRLAMVALQLVAMHFFGQRLESAVNISDRSDGLRSGMQYININHKAPEEEEVETPHCRWEEGAVIPSFTPSLQPPPFTPSLHTLPSHPSFTPLQRLGTHRRPLQERQAHPKIKSLLW